jgi:hypothetical protein
LQVLQDADRPAYFLLERADGRVDLGVIVRNAMAEVHAEGIDACQEQRLEHVRRSACRSHGRDDLCASVPMHGAAYLFCFLKSPGLRECR